MNTQKKQDLYVHYSNYHLWAVCESKFGSVVASFDTEQEAIDYVQELGDSDHD